ncbi:MAG TPA: hypothetical protein DF774_15070 [Rheinheimera sp.]|uniref:hypothetical protein n=1 Tax=Rheinheimera sp. TaxID=1869214 RepID=UPI000EC391A1|nr:hypothetical protein [Rheinheimera sp.]HCU67075.1 hypothetical protein [Rheinheimera sp.]
MPYSNQQDNKSPQSAVVYQTELQQQRLRRLASELDAITDPALKLQFIEQRLLDNLQQLKRQLAILQQELPKTADNTKPGC